MWCGTILVLGSLRFEPVSVFRWIGSVLAGQNEFKKEMPCIGNCMVIGDKRKFLTIIIALKVEVGATWCERLLGVLALLQPELT